MLSIQSIMLIALGFLTATLLSLIFAPALWNRAVRLTTQRIKARLPVTEAEIRADKDRLRAEFAMTVHRLEQKIEQADLKRARHMIELNRRDASIAQLEGEVTTLRANLDEHQNARRVLEHTISDRLPKVELRLEEARTLLATRDSEIGQLTNSTTGQQQALEEARAINAQQSAEIERLTTALTVRGGRNSEALNDPSVSGEVALRAELEQLRAKSREQAALIARLQHGGAAAHEAPNAGAAAAASIIISPPDEARAQLAKELAAMTAKAEDQGQRLKSLAAELEALRSAEAAATPDSKVSLRARLAGMETANQQQTEQIARLRAEIAAANERMAAQGAHFMEQMRRLSNGAANGADAGSARRSEPQRRSLAERVVNARGRSDAAANDTSATPEVAPERDGSDGVGAKPSMPRLVDRISSLSKV